MSLLRVRVRSLDSLESVGSSGASIDSRLWVSGGALSEGSDDGYRWEAAEPPPGQATPLDQGFYWPPDDPLPYSAAAGTYPIISRTELYP